MNNKGFSMIELLAVIVVLGIISTIGIVSVLNMTDKSKDEYYKIQNENFAMAAESFVNANRSFLPKEIGGVNKIYLDKLIQMKYIKENIYDQNKEPCDPDKSYVSIFKVSETEYKYVGYLNCPSCKTKDNYCAHDSNEVPKATVKLGSVQDANKVDQIKKATCSITMKGNESGNKKIFSYSYKIFTDEVLKYSSSTIRTSKTSLSFNLNNLVSQYTPGKVRVILSVTNEDGYTKTVSDSYSYGDTTKPLCGNTTNEGKTKTTDDGVKVCADDQWVRSRNMFIMCDDVHGVGCKMHEFSEHFTRESKPYGLDSMKIYDTSDNDYDCPVYTCIDLTPPKMNIEMYKNDKDGKPTGKPIKTFNVNKVETDQDLGWFNTDYPKGVTFKVKVEDNILLKSFKYQYNDKNLYMSAAEKDKFKNNGSNSVDNYYKLSYETTSSISAEGRRYVKFQAFDGAGNEASISFKLEIDRTAPTLKIDVGRCGDRNDTNCRNYASPTDTGSATAKQGELEKTINKKNWVSKGLKISYNTTDHNSLTNVWSWDKQYSMTTAGNATKANSFDSSTINSNNEDVTLTGSVALTGTGQRQGIMTATDPAGNSVKVTINVFVANICTITFDPNVGTFGANSSAADRTWKIDYDSYVGSADNGLPNAVGSSSYFKGTRNYYSIESNKHWNTSSTGSGGTIFDESKSGDNRYKAQNMCSGMTDGKDKTVTLYANWKKNTCTVTYNPGTEGSFTNNATNVVQTVTFDGSFGNNTDGIRDAKGGYYDAKRDYYHIEEENAWKCGSSYFNENQNYTAKQICGDDALKAGSVPKTFYVNWHKNTCTLNFYPGTQADIDAGARFTNHINDTKVVLDFDDEIGAGDDGMRNARGGYYKAVYEDHVVADLSEWFIYRNNKYEYLDQNSGYTADNFCENLRTTANDSVNIRVKWLTKAPNIKIYTWKETGKSCNYNSSDKNTTDIDKMPKRSFKFASYRCVCDYNTSDAELVSGKAYYVRHSSTRDSCKDSKWDHTWEHASTKQRQECFPENAFIFYRANSDGEKACKGDDDTMNQYVYQVCTNGDVYNNKDKGYKFFHGAYWYWTTGTYKAHLEKILVGSSNIRINHFDHLLDLDSDTEPGTTEHNSKLSESGSIDTIQDSCEDFCIDHYGPYRWVGGSEGEVNYIDEDD